ncbi:DUF2279 domain-containing protein [Pseudopedobacter beijingensis]|uniref:DUF2279 domain-containing protein n=1 Tax=Pseudopedobacter beijingensis TaxID=1207056 RepID=A0ABW4ID81_9SPHI
MLKNLAFAISLLCSYSCFAQKLLYSETETTFPKKDTIDSNKNKIIAISAVHALAISSSYFIMNEAWYKGYAKTSFHLKNDNDNWQQMDKAGHTWTTYQYSRLSTEVWRYAGLKRIPSAIAGTISGISMQTMMEILDGHSAQWGFSWGDMAANGIGALTFSLQEIFLNQQIVSIKMGYTQEKYPTQHLKDRAKEIYGESFGQRILKDYNSQTYWASVNIQSIIKKNSFPSWLNLAFGYGTSGMYGAVHNSWAEMYNHPIPDGALNRTRSFYISPDISLSRIHTNKKWLKSILFVADMIKIPAPTLEYNNRHKWIFRPLFM